MLLALLQDKFFAEHIAFLEPRILLGKFLAHILRLLLAVAHRGEALFLYAVFYQIVYYRLGAALRQMLVIFAVSLIAQWALSSMVTCGFSFSSVTSWSRAVVLASVRVALSKS